MRKHQILVLICLASSAYGQKTSCGTGKDCREAGQCKEFVEKRNILASFSRGSIQYRKALSELKRLVCNRSEKKVCCTKQVKPSSNSPSWVPSQKEGCGFSSGSLGFIVGGNDTKLGEFPWTVLLGRKSSSGRTLWKCGGTLINKWYVLTAAHCLNSIDVVRVGEWEVVDTSEIKTKRFSFECTAYNEKQCSHRRCSDGCNVVDGEVDCAVVRGSGKICAERHQDVDVEEVKIHDGYTKMTSGIGVNDIALLKLRHPVELNKFVVPICLADAEESKRLRLYGEQGKERLLSNGKPTVVGWGVTYKSSDLDVSIVSAAQQQKLEVPIVSNRDCARSWNKLSAGVGDDIRQGEHICAGGESGKDSCKGDSGGSLIGRDGEDNPYMLVGVVSSGTSICGLGTPAIYTRVAYYREWILKNLE